MNKNRNQRIQELFVGALDLDPAEQEEWLRSECGDDQAMLNEVLDLLRHDQPTADPLERGLDREVLSDVGLVQRQDQSGLHVRCPHCHHPIELVDEAELSDVVCESCGSSFSLIAADETKSYSTSKPTKIAHFDLIERVGIGAFGSVFKARDTKLDRIVAVKVPRKGQLSGDEAEKFLREARTAAQLKHPNIVAVHEVGREDDRVFIVSDFVDGVTLSDWLTGLQPTPRETAELCITIARALQYAHEHGVIHRDLKPGNIMLDRNNQPFLMDFGLAKREAAEITMTVEGQVLGTPAYMSPEQARGDAHSVDGTTDIYAVGVILFEMLTGERPFRGNLRMLLHQVLTEEAPSPRKYNASIPRDLETVCLKCLEKTPARRYDTAENLADDLQRFIEHKPIDARPITSIERGWRWCKRKPAIASLVAMLFLTMAIGAAVSGYFAIDAQLKANHLADALVDADDQRDIAIVRANEADAQRKKTAAALEQVEKEQYASSMLLTSSLISGNQFDRAVARLNEIPSEHRHWEWGHLADRCLNAAIELKVNDADARDIHSIFALSHDGVFLAYEPAGQCGVTILDLSKMSVVKKIALDIQGVKTVGPICGFSSDDNWLVTGGWGKPIRVWDVKNGKLHKEIHNGERTHAVRFARKKPIIAVAHSPGLSIWNVESGDEIIHQIEPRQWHVVFLPGDDRIVLGQYGHPIYDIRKESINQKFEVQVGVPWPPVVSDDGSRVAMMGTNSDEVFVHDSESLEFIVAYRHAPHPTSVCFDDSNSVLITGGRDGTVRVWDEKTHDVVHEFSAHSEAVLQCATAKNGQWLVTSGRELVIRVWPASWLVKKSNTNRSEWLVSMSPDSGSLAVMHDGNKGVSIFNLSNPHTPVQQIPAGGHVYAGNFNRQLMSWSMDGSKLAVSFLNNGAYVVDANTGERLVRLDSKYRLESVLFTMDDAMVVAGSKGRVEFFDARTGAKAGELSGFRGEVSAMCIVKAPGIVAAAGQRDSEITLLDASQMRAIKRIQIEHVGIADMDCDATGRRLIFAVHSDSKAIVLDVGTGEKISQTTPGTRTHHQLLYSVAISPDGRRMVALTRERKANLYDCDSGALLLQLDSNANELRDIDWSSDGSTLVAAGDGFDHVKVWRSADCTKSLTELRAEKQSRWDYDDPFGLIVNATPVDLSKLQERFARSLQWNKALEASASMPNGSSSWQHLAILFMTEQHDEYRLTRSKFLAGDFAKANASQCYHSLLAALLLPLNDTDHNSVRFLAERVFQGTKDWEKQMAASAMYRLGEFDEWMNKLPEDSPLKAKNTFQRACVNFQSDPSEQNRRALNQIVEREEKNAENQIKEGVLPRHWHNYVQRIGWIEEGKRLLTLDNENDKN